MFSYRRETALKGALVGQMWKSGTGKQYLTDIVGLSIRWKQAKQRLLHRSRSFKVIQISTSRKPVCDFLSVI